MRGVLELTAPLLPVEAPSASSVDIDDLMAGSPRPRRLRLRDPHPPRPPRHRARPRPRRAFRLDLRNSGWEGEPRFVRRGLPLRACTRHDRDYISYLSRAEELTAVRLLCLHNLTFLHHLMSGARRAIENRASGLQVPHPRRRLTLQLSVLEEPGMRLLEGSGLPPNGLYFLALASRGEHGESSKKLREEGCPSPHNLIRCFSTSSLNSPTTLSTVSPALPWRGPRWVGCKDHRGRDRGRDQDQRDHGQDEPGEAGEHAPLRGGVMGEVPPVAVARPPRRAAAERA